MVVSLFCTPEYSDSQLKSFFIASKQFFLKRNMVTVNRQSFPYILVTSPSSLLFDPRRGLTDADTAHLFQ